jgi:hypothetical protein
MTKAVATQNDSRAPWVNVILFTAIEEQRGPWAQEAAVPDHGKAQAERLTGLSGADKEDLRLA